MMTILAARTADVERPDANRHNRLAMLDGLRGVAAAVVVLSHAASLYGRPDWLKYFPLKLLIAGPSAVLLFFALSGYVLTATYLRKDRSYWPYAIKRFVRIYVPFAAAVLIAAALSAAIGQAPIPGASDWFNYAGWQHPVTGALIWAHLSMGSAVELDNPIWSLFHEMRISLVLPALALILMKRPVALLAITGLIALTVGYPAQHVLDQTYLVGCLNSLQYLPLFVAGGALAIYPRLVARLVALPASWRGVLIVLSLAFLSVGPQGLGPFVGANIARLVICSTGAVSLMAFALGGGWMTDRILTHRVALYLGWVSYSLYLTHLPVLEVIIRLTAGWLPHWVQIVLWFATVLPMAHVFRITFESNGQRLSRLAGSLIAGHSDVAEPGLGSARI